MTTVFRKYALPTLGQLSGSTESFFQPGTAPSLIGMLFRGVSDIVWHHSRGIIVNFLGNGIVYGDAFSGLVR